MSEKQILTVNCPFCASVVEYNSGSSVATCGSCDRSFDVQKALKESETSHYSGPTSVASLQAGGFKTSITPVQAIDDSENGLAYINNFFDKHDWEEYKYSSEIFISEIVDMVEKIKMKNAASCSTWELDFVTVSTLVNKKIEGLTKLREEIVEPFTGEDDTELLDELDNISRVSSALIAGRRLIIQNLKTDIEYFVKYGGAKTKAAEFEKVLKQLEKNIGTVTHIDDLYQIPEIQEKIKKKEKEVLKKYEAMGLDVESIYAEAIKNYEEGKQTKAVELLYSIREYKDCARRISYINSMFRFGSEYYRFGNYSFAKGKNVKLEGNRENLLNMKNIKSSMQKVDAEQNQETDKGLFALYPVTDAMVEKDPLIADIASIICSFGSNIYYVGKKQTIKVYNLDNKTTTTLMKLHGNATLVDFNEENSHYFSKDGRKLLFKTTINTLIKQEAAGGCSKKASQPIAPKVAKKVNNFNLHVINLATSEINHIGEEVTDIVDAFNDEVFVTISFKDEEKNVTTKLYEYRFDTNSVSSVLNENCAIHNVVNNHVIFSKWDPNSLNENLYSFSMETRETILIEDNIYNYFDIINDRVYYTVGNLTNLPLFSNSIKGDDRKEILNNVESIFAIKAGYMYAVKSHGGLNKRLVKISADGNTRYTVCGNFSKIIQIVNGYVYFLDRNDCLRIVRSDGCKERLIAENVDPDNVIVSTNYIFFTRREVVGRKVVGQSLYRLDLSGHNLKKLVFNVLKVQDYDTEYLYYSKKLVERYECVVRQPNGQTDKSVSDYNLSVIYKFSKTNFTSEEILVTGRPSDKTTPVENQASGCGSKKQKQKFIHTTYTKLPLQITYTRDDRAKAGELSEEQQLAADMIASSVGSNTNTAGCPGCSGSSATKTTSKPAVSNTSANNINGCGCGAKK